MNSSVRVRRRRVTLRPLGVFLVIGLISGWALSVAAAVHVSMVQLLINGQSYVGTRIEVVGYLSLGTTLALYLARDNALASDYSSSIAVGKYEGIIESSCLSRYVRARGIVQKPEARNHLILAVDEILLTNRDEVCWSRRPQAEVP